MGLYKKLDLWSVYDGLEEIVDSYCDAQERDSQYWDYYSDQINELGILAADMLEELRGLKERIWYKLPYKNLEFYRDWHGIKTETGTTAKRRLR